MKGIIDLLKKTGGFSVSNSTLLVALWGGLFCFAVTYGQPSTLEFEDGTGTIRIRVKTCDWVESEYDQESESQVAKTVCPEDNGWTTVGGGAEICCGSEARLQRNFPDPSLREWTVRSSDPASGPPHQLRAYAILMQLVDEFGQAFAPNVNVSDVNEPCTFDEVTGICIDEAKFSDFNDFRSKFVLIGGGAEAKPPADPQGFLIESRPIVAENGELAWRSGARLDPNNFSNTANVRSWLIGIDLCPEEWNGGCLSYPMIRNLVSDASFGRNTVDSTITSSWIPTSIGGQAIAQGNQERYLEDLIPLNGNSRGFSIESKSGDEQNSGATLGSALIVGKVAAIYQYNAIRFNTAGTALSAFPFGGDDRLWQTNQYPLSDWAHWHLDPIRSTVPTAYLLRNGNPDHGSECAYWDGGNEVRVGACDEGNLNFHWSKIGDFVFQLLNNQSTNLCLDNGDQGFVPAALTLEPCNNGYSPEQSLFLDAYDWPVPAVEQNSPFRFEELSYWSSSASLALDSVVKTDGESGLSIGGSGYRVVNSVPVRTPLAGFGSTLLLDVYLPGDQSNPYWLGAVQVYASCPEAEMNNVYLGQSELTGLPTEAFSTLEYPLSEEIRDVLSQNRDDCFFSVAVNMNATPENPVLDNLRFIP